MVEKKMLFALLTGTLISTQILAASPENKVTCKDSRQLIQYTSAKFEDYREFLKENRISLVTPTYSARNLQEFIYEYQKFPLHLRTQMIEAGATIHLVSGKSVMDDPAWNDALKQTFDGRDQSSIAGAGGIPYVYKNSVPTIQKLRDYCDLPTSENAEICLKNWRETKPDEVPTIIVINRLYNGMNPRTKQWFTNHGSMNLVLHEHAHALDSMYALNQISDSEEFKLLLNDPRNKTFLGLLGTYVDGIGYSKNSSEAFAEIFAYYYACSESQQQMTRLAPDLANFIEHLNPERDTEAPATEAEATPVVEKKPTHTTTKNQPQSLKEAFSELKNALGIGKKDGGN